MIRIAFLSITILTAVALSFPLNVNKDFGINISVEKDSVLSSKDEEFFKDLPLKLLNPTSLLVDLDSDENDELFIVDSDISLGIRVYKFYICKKYNDGFIVVDSSKSGVIKPLVYYDEEFKKNLILIGYSEFDSLNSVCNPNNIYSPINILTFNGETAYSINEELYDIFFDTNDILLNTLNSLPYKLSDPCEDTKENLPLIYSIYINYINAGEYSLAENFLRIYYKCDDLQKVKSYLAEF